MTGAADIETKSQSRCRKSVAPLVTVPGFRPKRKADE
jgi:hypothetical protein